MGEAEVVHTEPLCENLIHLPARYAVRNASYSSGVALWDTDSSTFGFDI
jgi:hypothetical protein